MTPEQVHYGRAKEIYQCRTDVLQTAFERFPLRFKGKVPKPPQLPQAQEAAKGVPVWISNTPFASYFVPDGRNKPLIQLTEKELSENDIRFEAAKKLFFRLKQFSAIHENRLLLIRNKPVVKETAQYKLFKPPVIIVSGYSSSGKTTVSMYLRQKYNIDHIEESSVVTSEISLLSNLDRKTAINKIVKQFGPLHFIKKALNGVNQNRNNPLCISGIRTLVEVEYLKKHCPFTLLLYIDGHIEMFKMRHQIKCQRDNSLENSYQKLIDNENQWGMELIKQNADYVINNNCNFELLYYQIDEFYDSVTG